MPDKKQLHAIVHGRVQGVGFRYHTQEIAQAIGVVGWVRNKLDRSVEVVAEGTDVQLKRFLDFLHEGPTMAHVVSVDVNWRDATGEFTEFQITY